MLLPGGFAIDRNCSTYGDLAGKIGKTKAKAAVRKWYEEKEKDLGEDKGLKRERESNDEAGSPSANSPGRTKVSNILSNSGQYTLQLFKVKGLF